jgi:hypothetical protein
MMKDPAVLLYNRENANREQLSGSAYERAVRALLSTEKGQAIFNLSSRISKAYGKLFSTLPSIPNDKTYKYYKWCTRACNGNAMKTMLKVRVKKLVEYVKTRCIEVDLTALKKQYARYRRVVNREMINELRELITSDENKSYWRLIAIGIIQSRSYSTRSSQRYVYTRSLTLDETCNLLAYAFNSLEETEIMQYSIGKNAIYWWWMSQDN